MPRTFTTRPLQTADEVAARLMDRCRAAARLTMGRASYSAEERADATATIAAQVLSQALSGSGSRPLCSVCGGPADRQLPSFPDDFGTLVTLARCYRHGRGRKTRSIIGDAPLLDASFTALYRDALNYRQSLDRQRARDAAEAAQRAADDAFVPHVAGDVDTVRGTPWGARRTALEMLRALGELAEGESPKGAAWTVAYAAARAAAGLEPDDIARELDIEPATYRQHLSRAAKTIGAGLEGESAPLAYSRKLRKGESRVSRTDHRAYVASRLSIPEPVAVKASKSRDRAATPNDDDWRTRPENAAPVIVSYRVAGKTTTARAGSIATTRPDWTRDLPAGTNERLRKAVEVKRARMLARDADSRKAVRLASGIPG